MATKREWLITKGLAKAGRGKFSNEAKAAIAKAEAEGIVFDDIPAPAKAATKPKADKPKVSADTESTEYVGEIMFANEFPNYGREWFVREGKKRISIGGATVCGNCRYSLIGHICNDPVVLRNGEFVTVEG